MEGLRVCLPLHLSSSSSSLPWPSSHHYCHNSTSTFLSCRGSSRYSQRRRRRRQVSKWGGLEPLVPKRALVASSKGEEPLPSNMSVESAQKLLGVSDGASFEDILMAKNSILARTNEDQELAIQVEAAYDLLLMQSLMQRRAGKVVDGSIRYADVRKPSSKSGIAAGLGGPEWFQKALRSSPVSIETPPSSFIGIQTAVFTSLMVWNYASGLSNSQADVPGFILAIGVGASVFSLRKRNVGFGKAAGITVAALTFGALSGNAVESLLRVDVIPVLGFSSAGVFVSEFALVSLWLSSLFLC